MPKIEISARAKVRRDEKGRAYLDTPNPDWWAGELARFDPDTDVVHSVKKWYKKRTIDQNNMFHWWVTILADYFGYTLEDMKIIIALKWLREEISDDEGKLVADPETGEVLFTLRSTADLDTFEMGELCDKMKVWAKNGWNITLPDPDKNYKINFKK